MVNKDCDQLDVILFLQMADVTENAIYQTVGTDLTVREASADCFLFPEYSSALIFNSLL